MPRHPVPARSTEGRGQKWWGGANDTKKKVGKEVNRCGQSRIPTKWVSECPGWRIILAGDGGSLTGGWGIGCQNHSINPRLPKTIQLEIVLVGHPNLESGMGLCNFGSPTSFPFLGGSEAHPGRKMVYYVKKFFKHKPNTNAHLLVSLENFHVVDLFTLFDDDIDLI